MSAKLNVGNCAYLFDRALSKLEWFVAEKKGFGLERQMYVGISIKCGGPIATNVATFWSGPSKTRQMHIAIGRLESIAISSIAK